MRRFGMRILALFLILFSIACLAGAGTAEDTLSGTEEAGRYDRLAASVVRLEVYNKYGERIGTGSGFAAFEPAVLVTDAHVIVNMDYMIATKDDGTTFRIEKAFEADTDSDIALCILPEDAGIVPLQPAGRGPARGDTAIAISSQFGLINLVTIGNVCGRWDAGGVRWILFTAPVSGGSSGGPLLNDEGLVTGVITGTYDKGQNLNLAAPYETVAALMSINDNRGGTSK